MALSGSSVSLNFQLVRIRRVLLNWLTISTNAILFAAIALVIGIGSAFWVDRKSVV